MPKKADDAGGLSPTKEENAFRYDLDRRESGCSINNQYEVKPGIMLGFFASPSRLQPGFTIRKIGL